ncbi:MAG: phosphodiester glycosidase family protein [Pseudomonadota bacterium]
MKRIWLSIAAIAFLGASNVHAAECQKTEWEGVPMIACEVDVSTADLRLFHSTDQGKLLGQFSAVNELAKTEGKSLTFAMNAGMYHKDRAPVGLYVEKGEEQARLVTNKGPGNFGLLPNGVFCIQPDRVDVIESRTFARSRPNCEFASQSGPMLVINGALHPRFLENSTSLYTRNGVGTSRDGKKAVFVIADAPVNFHRFARYFRDVLKTPNALYFDGNISKLWWPAGRRRDFGFTMGPIVGAFE